LKQPTGCFERSRDSGCNLKTPNEKLQMKKTLLISIILFCSVVYSKVQWSIDDVILNLESNQAANYVTLLLSSPDWKEYEDLLSEIENGTPKWLRVAVLLKKHTDAAASLSLSITLAQTIKNNPSGVFELLSNDEIKWSCSVPLIEPTKSEFSEFITKTMAAVNSIENTKVASKKAICLNELSNAKKVLDNKELTR
jgi:hypothetical protein